jgi:hypothetical protein
MERVLVALRLVLVLETIAAVQAVVLLLGGVRTVHMWLVPQPDEVGSLRQNRKKKKKGKEKNLL